jgi:hypothetical protein
MRLGTGALIGAFGFALATTGISAAQAYTLSYSIDLPTSSATQILVVQQGYDYHFGLEFYGRTGLRDPETRSSALLWIWPCRCRRHRWSD